MKRQQGFTLIEVVVAVAILGISASSIFGLLSTSVSNLTRIEKLHRYQLGSQEVMNRVLLLPVLPANGRSEGRLKGTEAEWSVRVEPWIPSDLEGRPEEAIVKITVEIEFDGRSDRRRIRLEAVKPSRLSYEPFEFVRALEDVFPD